MMNQNQIEFFSEKLHTEFLEQFVIKHVSGTQGDFGDLKGVQFDSEDCGGFLYFWSSGAIEYQLVDYKQGEEVIPITLLQGADNETIEKLEREIVGKIKGLRP